jgi:ribonuclease J
MPNQDELLFLPLGGAGEIGMNLNLYGYGPRNQERWMMVDLGITFGDGTIPGVDVIMPDPAFIEERLEQLDALVLTHAHEDHLGAVAHLWRRLRCPVYATPFTADILSHKLAEAGLDRIVDVRIIPLGGKFSIGPFDLELITLTHSIPEPNAIAIRTPVGTVLHTGDWKFDPNPVVGEVSDEVALKKLGEEGTLAIVCDSTNVFNEGTSGSEGDLLESLTDLISTLKERVVVSCFASNVARLQTIAAAAQANDKNVVLAGRALWRFSEVGRAHGCLENTPEFLNEDQAGFLPRNKTLIICTGSQGEPRAALSRIASGRHPRISLDDGDSVIFSSRVIPGNEASIGYLHNQLVRAGIQVITEQDHFVHVSGHPAREEMVRMYQHVRPTISIPVHGELRHMAEHARLAHESQVTYTLVGENGSLMRIAPGEPKIIDHVHSGRLALEGNRVVPLQSELIRGRKRALWNGTAVLTLVVNKQGKLLSNPLLATTGVLEDGDGDLHNDVITEVKRFMEEDSYNEKTSEHIRLVVRGVFKEKLNKKPMTKVHMVEI